MKLHEDWGAPRSGVLALGSAAAQTHCAAGLFATACALVQELQRAGVIGGANSLPQPWHCVAAHFEGQLGSQQAPPCQDQPMASHSERQDSQPQESQAACQDQPSLALHRVCSACSGWSGRALRRLPFLAHARGPGLLECTSEQMLAGMLQTACSDALQT